MEGSPPTTPAEGLSTVPEEVWSQILSYIRRPVHQTPSQPDRSALKQPDLVSAMRVSKHICQSVHYTNVVTDDFPLLIRHLNPALASADSPLRYTRQLFIEYRNKSAELSYDDLMRKGGWLWAHCGPVSAKDRSDLCYALHRTEIHDMAECMPKMRATGIDRTFPRLDTIAVAALYGQLGPGWIQDPIVNGQEKRSCVGAFQLLVGSSRRLKHLCMRDANGPLGQLGVNYHFGVDSLPRTVHFGRLYPGQKLNRDVPELPQFYDHLLACRTADMPAMDTLPLHRGAPLQWVLEAGSPDNFANLAFCVMRQDCLHPWLYLEVEPPGPRQPINLEIFCSTPEWDSEGGRQLSAEVASEMGLTDADRQVYNLAPDEQDRLAGRLGEEAQRFLRTSETSTPNDSIRWRGAWAAPVCPACGTGPPQV